MDHYTEHNTLENTVHRSTFKLVDHVRPTKVKSSVHSIAQDKQAIDWLPPPVGPPDRKRGREYVIPANQWLAYPVQYLHRIDKPFIYYCATYERVRSQSLYINGPFYARSCGTERMPLVQRPHERAAADMKSFIHSLETEAYGSVLKALIAQSDLLSWEKEGLITMLRKELNVTDIEHGELLVKINSDESIKMIREKRKGTLFAEKLLYAQMSSSGNVPGLPGDTSLKRLKASHAAAPEPQSQKYVPHGQPSSSPISSYFTAQLRDEQQRDQLATVPAGNSMKVVWHNSEAPLINKVRGPQKSQLMKGCLLPYVGDVKKKSDVIEIRATDKLIQEVEELIYGRRKPNASQVEKAKLLLRDHERAIIEALDKLADVLHEDHLQHHYSENQLPGTQQGVILYNDSTRQPSVLNGSRGQGFVQTHSHGQRVRFIDISDGEVTPNEGY